MVIREVSNERRIVSAYVPLALALEIQARARREDQSVSSTIRRALDEHLLQRDQGDREAASS